MSEPTHNAEERLRDDAEPTVDADTELPVTWVERSELSPPEWNVNEASGTNREVLKQSIKTAGWTQPILAQPDGTIVHGESRWFVSRHPDIRDDESLTPDGVPAAHIPVHIVEMSDKDAMAATYQHNAATGSHNPDAVADLVMGMDEMDRALDKLSMDESELVVQEETGTDVSDVEFTDETSDGAFTEMVSFAVSDPDAVTEQLGEVSTQRLLALCRFIVETDLHERIPEVPDPVWDEIPDRR
jgi:hypothetical protein